MSFESVYADQSVLNTPEKKQFWAALYPLFENKKNAPLVEKAGLRFIEIWDDAVLKRFKENPYDLVTDCDLPFYCFRKPTGGLSMKQSVYPIPTFNMHLKAVYAFLFDLLRMNEQNGHSFETVHDLYLKMRKCFDVTIEDVRCYLYAYRETFCYDRKDDTVGFLFRKRQEDYIYDKLYALSRKKTDVFKKTFEDDHSLYPEQNRAVVNALSSGLSIITGGPGTGKTTVLKTLLHFYQEVFKEHNAIPNIRLLAPTGKAARRMKESIGEYGETSTIASLIYSLKMHGVQEGHEVYDLVVIDEASMINATEFYYLLVYADIKQLVLVGDTDQLPAVGNGDILRDMELLGASVSTLTENHRSSRAIQDNAKKIKEKDASLSNGEGFQMKDVLSKDLEDKAIILWAENKDRMILTPFREQAERINLRIHKMLFGDVSYVPGDKVMFLKNHKKEGWLNGDMGTVVSLLEDAVVVRLDCNEEVIVKENFLNEMTYGYAMTVHKSQGSEYKDIVILLPSGTSSFFSRKILYTAVTRAKNDVLIIGSSVELEKIITSENEDRRNTFIKKRIREADETSVRVSIAA